MPSMHILTQGVSYRLEISLQFYEGVSSGLQDVFWAGHSLAHNPKLRSYGDEER